MTYAARLKACPDTRPASRRIRLASCGMVSEFGLCRWFELRPVGLRSVRAVPPGLDSPFPPYPALKRWAKLGRPYGAEFSGQQEASARSTGEGPGPPARRQL